MCTLVMLHLLYVVQLYLLCTYFMLHFSRVVHFLCCTFSMLHFFYVKIFTSCTFFVLYSFMLHLFVCSTHFILHLFSCCFLLHSLSVAFFSCCTHFVSHFLQIVVKLLFFVLHSFHIARFFVLHSFDIGSFFFFDAPYHFYRVVSCCLKQNTRIWKAASSNKLKLNSIN